MTAKPADNLSAISELSFEAALKELEQIVRALESGTAELEHSIADYARGTALKEHCMKKLEVAKLHVEKISVDSSGSAVLSPFES